MPITKTNPCAPHPSTTPSKIWTQSQGFKMGIGLRFLSFNENPLYPHSCPKLPRKLLESLSPSQFICLLLCKFWLKESTDQQRQEWELSFGVLTTQLLALPHWDGQEVHKDGMQNSEHKTRQTSWVLGRSMQQTSPIFPVHWFEQSTN